MVGFGLFGVLHLFGRLGHLQPFDILLQCVDVLEVRVLLGFKILVLADRDGKLFLETLLPALQLAQPDHQLFYLLLIPLGLSLEDLFDVLFGDAVVEATQVVLGPLDLLLSSLLLVDQLFTPLLLLLDLLLQRVDTFLRLVGFFFQDFHPFDALLILDLLELEGSLDLFEFPFEIPDLLEQPLCLQPL